MQAVSPLSGWQNTQVALKYVTGHSPESVKTFGLAAGAVTGGGYGSRCWPANYAKKVRLEHRNKQLRGPEL